MEWYLWVYIICCGLVAGSLSYMNIIEKETDDPEWFNVIMLTIVSPLPIILAILVLIGELYNYLWRKIPDSWKFFR